MYHVQTTLAIDFNLIFDPKIDRGSLWVIGNTCGEYHHFRSNYNGAFLTGQIRRNQFKRSNFFTPIQLGHILDSLGICVCSLMIADVKGKAGM